jgi:hypothetical protein
MSDDKKPETIVVSLRLKPELAAAFRTEAARRNTRLVRLFEEIWELYQSQPSLPIATPRRRK